MLLRRLSVLLLKIDNYYKQQIIMKKYFIGITTLALSVLFAQGAYAQEITGAITLTFDDANKSQLEYVYPIMAASGHPGVMYVATALTYENDDYYVSWEDLQLLESVGWEVGSHSVTHAELPEVPVTEMHYQVFQSLNDLFNHSIFAVESFATPYGAYDPTTLAAIARSYDSHRGFHEVGYNAWPYNKYYLHVKQITNQTTLAEVETWVDEALQNDYWLIIAFHEVLPTVESDDAYSWTVADFQSLIDYLDTRGVQTKTTEQVLARTNLLANGSFKNGFTDWTIRGAEGTVTIDENNMGSFPESLHSVKMIGSDSNSFLFGPMMNVSAGSEYGIRFFANTVDLTSGELGYYIDEYDVYGNWISGKWLGMANNQFVLDESYRYTPSSERVATASLQVYLTGGSTGTAYVDSIEFFRP
jgi:peptidoglycan/xylan/chitin deacetylase (PgdA/CDA1 family)